MDKQKISLLRKTIYMLLGTVLIGVGIAIYRLTALGNDALASLNFSLHELTGISYTMCNLLVSVVLFFPMIIFEKNKIHIGTLVNMIAVGLVVDLVLFVFEKSMIDVSSLHIVFRFMIAGIGVVVEVFGISLYVTADFGIAPYDAASIILQKKLHIDFKYARWIVDGSCVITAFIISNIILGKKAVGIFTLFALLFVSPLLNFFNKLLSGYYKNKHTEDKASQ